MIRQYRVGDFLKVISLGVQAAQVDEVSLEDGEAFDAVGAFSLTDEKGMVLAVFGYEDDEKELTGVGYALLSSFAGARLIEVVRFLRQAIFQIMQKEAYQVFYLTVKRGFSAGTRFALMLGFEPKAYLPKFYNNMDYQVFERRK